MRKGRTHSPWVMYKLVFGYRQGWGEVRIKSTAPENPRTNGRKNRVDMVMAIVRLGENWEQRKVTGKGNDLCKSHKMRAWLFRELEGICHEVSQCCNYDLWNILGCSFNIA